MVASLSLAGNAYLADMFRQRGKEVTILPTTVDPAHYSVKRHAPSGAIGLVWIGSSSTLPYLQQCLPAIAEAAREVPGLRLITIADRRLERSPVAVEHVRWSVHAEAEALARGDVGIAPTPDDRWTRGKCGFKIIQYMATGLPTIASPVGANSEIVRPETGVLATTHDEWLDALLRLAGDAPLRRSMGTAARHRVEHDYSLNRAADVWSDLLAR